MQLVKLPIFLSILLLMNKAFGLQCSKDSILKRYNIEHVFHWKEDEIDTPPSTRFTEWFVNICNNDVSKVSDKCNDDDLICGLEWIKVPDKELFLAKVIHFTNSDIDVRNYFGRYKGWMPGSLSFDFHEVRSGNVFTKTSLRFSCDKSLNEDKFEFDRWFYDDNHHLSIHVTGPSACKKDEYKDDDRARNPYVHKPKKGRSWFMWLLISILAFALIYFIVTWYHNLTGNTIWDLLSNIVEQIITIFNACLSPISRMLGGVFNRNSDVDGYSAL